MTKKNIITVVILFALLGLLVAALTIVRRNAAPHADTTQEARPPADTADSDGIPVAPGLDFEDMTRLHYKNNVSELTFEKTVNDAWRLADDPDFPLESSYVRAMASAVTGLTASRALDGEDPEYGFDTPSLTVDAEFPDGTTLTFIAGETNEFNSAIYLKYAESGEVFLVDASFASFFNYTREDFLCLDTPPDPDPESVTSVTVKNSEGEERTITDGDGISACVYLIKKIDFSADGAFYADDETLGKCGLSTDGASAQIVYKGKGTQMNDDGTTETVDVDETFKVVFGDSVTVTETDESGEKTEREFYYYALPGGHVVYRVSATYYHELMRCATREK